LFGTRLCVRVADDLTGLRDVLRARRFRSPARLRIDRICSAFARLEERKHGRELCVQRFARYRGRAGRTRDTRIAKAEQQFVKHR
jgi:hypothetical protein